MSKFHTGKSLEYQQGFIAGADWQRENAIALKGPPTWRYVLLAATVVYTLIVISALLVAVTS